MAKKSWMSHNNKVFKDALKNHHNDIKRSIDVVLQEVAQEMQAYIGATTYNQGDGNMPFYSGNLSDSTGLGIYIDGRLRAFAPPQRATHPQSMGWNYTNVYGIWGHQELANALSEASTTYSNGLWVVLFSAMPYAIKINEGTRYWDKGYFDEVLVKSELLPAFKNAFTKEFPNIVKQMTSI